MLENLYFGVVMFIDSKCKFLIFQSTQGLCKMSHDNQMMIRFVGDEMTLKTTLFLCDPIVSVNALDSCVTRVMKKTSDHQSLKPPLVSLSPPMPSYIVVLTPY
jgi:extradiol dioxygenase family protein